MIQISKISFNGVLMENFVFNDVDDMIKVIHELRDLKVEYTDEEVAEPIEEVVEEVIEEVIEEVVDEEEENTIVSNKMTIEDIVDEFNQSELSPNSKKKYSGAIKRIITWFEFNIQDLFMNNTDLIIESINKKYPNINTQKLYISALMNLYKFYDLTDKYDKVYSMFN